MEHFVSLTKYFLSAVVTLTSGTSSAPAQAWEPSDGQKQIPIWSAGKQPDPLPIKGPEIEKTSENLIVGKPWVALTNVSNPTITLYPAKEQKGSGKAESTQTDKSAKLLKPAVLVFPGGGYKVLAMDLEGEEICHWLNEKGITAVLLKYRVPNKGSYPKSPVALQDAQRAMGIIRQHAKEWQIDTNKIGVIGFSAGGHLVAAISNYHAKRTYPPQDAADKLSCRPDFAISIYPGHLWIDREKFALNPAVPVTNKTPPTFLLQCQDDMVDPPEHSLVYYRALKKAGVPVEMHLYAKGGHAFGLRRTDKAVTAWPELVEKWLTGLNFN